MEETMARSVVETDAASSLLLPVVLATTKEVQS
jgi:hypothetical protein